MKIAGRKLQKIILMSKTRGHIPVRTCVSCKSKMAKRDLTRLVLNRGNRMVVDSDGKEPGRGIYICHKESCMKNVLSIKRGKQERFWGNRWLK